MRAGVPYRTAVILVLSAAVSALSACAGSENHPGTPTDSSAAAAAPPQPASGGQTDLGAAGVWQGTTLASCAAFAYLPSRCNAQQKVTITLLQAPDGKLTGR